MSRSVRVLGDSLLVALALTAFSYLVALTVGWVGSLEELNWLEVFAVFTSYSCTYQCVFQSRWNYPMGLVTTVAYAVLFWQAGLYGSSVANIYLPLALTYGWFRWGPDGNTRPVQHLKINAWLLAYAATTVSIFFGVLWAVEIAEDIIQPLDAVGNPLDLQIPLADAVILALTILAQFLLDNKKLETWVVWAVINVFAIILYGQQGLYLVSLQYVLFLLNTAWGYYNWRKSMLEREQLHSRMQKYTRFEEPIVRSSGNVFADLGLPDAEELKKDADAALAAGYTSLAEYRSRKASS